MRVEFTIEPFVEGQPGRHVTAALDAAAALGAEVEFGPFGSTCQVAPGEAGVLIGAVVDAAIANGASHVNVHVDADADAETDLGNDDQSERQ